MPWTSECFYGASLSEGVATIGGITCVIRNLLFQIPPVIALVALGMVIWSGIRLISSGADPKAYASAMATLMYALIGILLLSGAWLILVLIERFTGAQVTQFGINP